MTALHRLRGWAVVVGTVVAALALPGGVAAAEAGLSSGLDPAGFDRQVRPQDDLFRAVNGPWLAATDFPPDKTTIGLSETMQDRADARVRELVEAAAAAPAAPGSIEQKIGSFYRSFIDEAGIDAAGTAPLDPWRAQIEGLTDRAALGALVGRLQGLVTMPLDVSVYSDPKEPGINRAGISQDGLGLPDRDYYLKRDARFAEARQAYLHYLETLFVLDGVPAADRAARAVFAFETRLARAQWSATDSQDTLKTYNPMRLPTLRQQAPGLDWTALFEAAAVPGIDRLTVAEPSYAAALARAAREVPLETWRLYLRARLLDDCADLLPRAFRDARFTFRGQALSGQQQPRPRWQKATAALDGALGEAVGQLYVARHFPPESKARAEALVGNLLQAFAQSIDTLAWMSPQTRRQAHDKLAKYTVKIGYPDKWQDYAGLEIRDSDAIGNAMRAGRFAYERMARRIGQPVDRSLWEMTPQTVNAYYEPSLNEIVFPAAILEPPLFDVAADDAVNYGGIGATIGHEISHGFDDQGHLYDGDGKLENWWRPADRKAFDALTSRLAGQFSAYEPIPGHKLNGRLTLGENIADLCGLEIALRAYHLSLHGQPAPVLDGFSGDQRFFLGFAQSWREKTRDERLLQLLVTDPHAPPAFRVDGAAVNVDGFHAAFGTRPGDRMYKAPEARIRIW